MTPIEWILRIPMQVKIAGLVAALLVAFSIVGAIDMRTEQERSAEIHEYMQRLAAARELERGYRDCPAPGPGMTDVVVMVIESSADAAPTVRRCFRFAERRSIRKLRQ